MKNRYDSDKTVEDILNVSTKLFLEKGYEKTSISDIVRGLDGLSKGAIYHHFDSKDDIITAVTRRLFLKDDYFETLLNRTDLSGQEMLQTAILESIMNEDIKSNVLSGYALLNNPRFYVEYLKVNAEVISPQVEKMIIKGNSDGSLNVEYPKYIAEVIVLLITGWYVNEIYPVNLKEFQEKFKATIYLFNGIGVKLFSDEFIQLVIQEEKE